MATTTKTKFEKSEFYARKNGGGGKSYLEKVSGYAFEIGDTSLRVHKDEGFGWGVTDPYTGMLITDHHDTRSEAIEEAHRRIYDFESYRTTERYDDLLAFYRILLNADEPLTNDELAKRVKRDRMAYERDMRERAKRISDMLDALYPLIYDAHDQVVGYQRYVAFGTDWAMKNPDIFEFINKVRTVNVGDGIELPNHVTSDREFAALAYAVKDEFPEFIENDRNHEPVDPEPIPETFDPVPVDYEPQDSEPAPVPEQDHPKPSSVDDFRSIFEGRGITVTQKRPGTCIWASGDTEPYKEQLKELGFRWSPKRRAWYLKAS